MLNQSEKSILVYAFALAFLAKALFLAFWVTPLWDIPDEPGHFSYARDIGSGSGFPLMGKAVIGQDVVESILREPLEKYDPAWPNYIAQHPPAFHIIAGAVWKLSSLVSTEEEFLFKSTRLVSAVAGALTLIVIFKILTLFGISGRESLAALALVAFLPMFTNLASGTGHDTTVTLFTCLAVFFWVRFLMSESRKDAYLTALWLSAAAATKMTALVIAVPMVAIVVIELSGKPLSRFKHTIGVSIVALSLPGLWMIRNFLVFGNPLAAFHNTLDPAFDGHGAGQSFVGYLTDYPVFETFFTNFFGYFGWLGTGMGQPWMIQIAGAPLTFYSTLSALLLILTLFRFIQDYSGKAIKPVSNAGRHHTIMLSLLSGFDRLGLSKPVFLLLFAVAVALASLTLERVFSTDNIARMLRSLSYALYVFLIAQSLTIFAFCKDRTYKLRQYSLMVIGFFTIVLIWQLYELFLGYGTMRAIHGRYFYPLFPLFFMVFLPPVLGQQKGRSGLLFILAACLAIVEVMTYSKQALPVYSGDNFPRILDSAQFQDHSFVGELVEGVRIEQAFYLDEESLRRARYAGAERAICVSVWMANYGRSTNQGLLDLKLEHAGKLETAPIDMSTVQNNSFQKPTCFKTFQVSELSPGEYRLTLAGVNGRPGSSVTTLLTADNINGIAIVNGEQASKSMFFYVSVEPRIAATFAFQRNVLMLFDMLGLLVILVAYFRRAEPASPIQTLSVSNSLE